MEKINSQYRQCLKSDDLHIKEEKQPVGGRTGFYSSGLYIYPEIIFVTAAAIIAEFLHRGDANLRLVLYICQHF